MMDSIHVHEKSLHPRNLASYDLPVNSKVAWCNMDLYINASPLCNLVWKTEKPGTLLAEFQRSIWRIWMISWSLDNITPEALCFWHGLRPERLVMIWHSDWSWDQVLLMDFLPSSCSAVNPGTPLGSLPPFKSNSSIMMASINEGQQREYYRYTTNLPHTASAGLTSELR